MQDAHHIEIIGLPAEILMREESIAAAIRADSKKRLEALAIYHARQIVSQREKKTNPNQKKTA